jgi:Tol biopolymer transport system component
MMNASRKLFSGCQSLLVGVFLFATCSVALSPSGRSDVTIFAPGAIPTSAPSNAAPAFTPDGNTVYFFQSSASNSSIVFSRRSGDQWSAPKTAVFSGEYRDLEPAFAPNGKYLIFASSRPTTPRGAQLDGHYNGQVFPEMGGNLWRVARTKNAWQKPQALPATINSNSSVFSPAVTADGSLYFMRAENGGKFHIYRAQMKGGKFETPVLASFSDADHGEYDPAVAPDESYLIFSSGRAPAPPKTTDLFIVFRTANGWGEPIDLRSALSDNVHGIEARLSPDGRTLYFSNSRSPSGADVPNGRYIWSVDLTDLRRAHGVRK